MSHLKTGNPERVITVWIGPTCRQDPLKYNKPQRDRDRRTQPHTYLHRSSVLKPLQLQSLQLETRESCFSFFLCPPPLSLSLSLSLSMSLYLPPLSLSPSSGLRTAVLRQTYWRTALWEVSILLFWLLGEQRVTERKREREREVGHELKHSLVLQLKSESSRTERAGLTSSGRSGAAQHTVT